ncbi:Phage related DNA methyltransferase [Thiomonas arsenitoxydans]|uniref:site-specific DNA-methyltransferase (adenine-specific) n=1 Tax=Thiomonas arsenitoxydans (strain DSM 22701 / CIP 110005 / 3As) TaxID=426114 RepID=D6CTI4_THIA3|nr:site-specific DNA-methyltransferase [Thiomonas arsenitoxydans]CQR44444.1 Phage related DNA methyltransferase [Thiomonas sp. CB3]CAZ88603.1 Phage related DNA methyltransferase [Thiomonas arsenitoxydans]CQR27681.1 Phage related DNA methyltransferase [Thiomonas arsenitoxydans]CQR32166.1 Phage related DNA methyltransferase [Thiomonas arsenitoxydans]CQR34614.1 Phage related DNA methyltransferase [Thiomonas arsenitoxydans]
MSSWLADKIEQWPTAKLVPYARNARTHSEAQVAQIAASIVEFGFTNPILAGSDGVIIAGHGRLAAAQKLGLEVVPVVVLEHLSTTQRRALVIADNRIAESAGWDEALLRIEMADLQDADFDLSITGFDAIALAELMAGDEPQGEGQTDDDAVPDVAETPVSRLGDVWLLGGHRLLCGDSTVAESYDRVLDGEPVDMVFTDPPYNVNYANSARDKMRGKERAILNDNLGDGFYDFLLAALTPTIAHCRGGIYVAMSSSELDVLQSAFRAAGGKWSTFIIWAKNTFTLGRADYQRQYEPILYGWPEGSQRHWCGDRDQGDVWNIKKPQKNDLHPTMKPVELVERAIRNSSRPGNVVLDPFGGSGTTLIAAEKSGRLARLIELDPKYADVIVRRWQDWTGKQATREADGVAFDQAASDSSMISQ